MYSGRYGTWGLHTDQAENWRGAEKRSGFWLYIYFTEGKSISPHPNALVSYGFLLWGDQGLNMSLLDWKQLDPKRFFYTTSKTLFYLTPQGDRAQPSILLYNCGTRRQKLLIFRQQNMQIEWEFAILNYFVKTKSIKMRCGVPQGLFKETVCSTGRTVIK